MAVPKRVKVVKEDDLMLARNAVLGRWINFSRRVKRQVSSLSTTGKGRGTYLVASDSKKSLSESGTIQYIASPLYITGRGTIIQKNVAGPIHHTKYPLVLRCVVCYFVLSLLHNRGSQMSTCTVQIMHSGIPFRLYSQSKLRKLLVQLHC